MTETLLEQLFLIHRLSSTHRPIDVRVDGKNYRVVGSVTSKIKAGLTVIQILTENSSPSAPKIDLGADKLFCQAARHLVETGEEFYTVFHRGWWLDAIRWSR